jgi:hypothetical protein
LKVVINVTAGVLLMYMDMSIADELRKMFGSTAGLNIALFFEEWRNYGQAEVYQRYPQRTFYYYLEKLLEAELIVKDGHGSYRIIDNLKEPVRLR